MEPDDTADKAASQDLRSKIAFFNGQKRPSESSQSRKEPARRGPPATAPKPVTNSCQATTTHFPQKEAERRNIKNSLFVVAIDFGTTYSGYAYSDIDDYKRDPVKVSLKTWIARSMITEKTPTCILIKPDGKTIESFGYDAESKYAELAEDKEQDKWFFFKNFKMMLFEGNGMKRKATLKDESGKTLSAITVFSLSIQYLKDDVMGTLNKQIIGSIGVSDIHWVLTVPAIWNDAAKQFMREAAQTAGIPGEMLTICLEPEAASIFCRDRPVSKSSSGETKSLLKLSSGTKYMVLDAGGGTVDITVHEVTSSDELKELHKASGGAWGGTQVDKAYEAFLISIVGSDVFKNFKTKHIYDYTEVIHEFEIKKKKISPMKQEQITIKMPASLSNLCIEKRGKDLELVLGSRLRDKVKISGDKLRVDVDVIRQFFQSSVQSITDHVRRLLKEPAVIGCTAILMVGGFSESLMLQEIIRVEFPDLRLIVPNEAGVAVLKGAVIFGHEPTAIAERVCKYTYGTESSHKYKNSCNHPKSRVEKDENGDMRCFDIFSIHVKAGQSVKRDDELEEKMYIPVSDDQSSVSFNIYSSIKTHPHLIKEEGCSLIGHFEIPITDRRSGRNHMFGASFIFGGTEIVVKVVDKETGDVTYESFNFLD